ncbi:elongation factor P-like protein YeiP [Motiliproteus sp. SC1-56]|uniref:elongation factor P-like protein EfpL n=1 Tax=Motiliproteus sp. SC1-56 TaxID=2799565 RepID=UPI001A8F25B1|nr:elongation factor P-like protein YeiP [Motiliproteus sp. SC1-56]
MPKACDLKRGQVVSIDDQLYIAKQIDVKSPSSRGAQTLYKIRFSRVPDGQKLEQSLTGDDQLKDADLQRRAVQLLFQEDDSYTFMDSEDYSQYQLGGDELSEALPYLYDGIEGLTALLVEGRMIALALPATVVMTVEETAPAIKGASASARTKPARFATGLEIQVPEYLGTGEQVKINTQTGKFVSRA